MSRNSEIFGDLSQARTHHRDPQKSRQKGRSSVRLTDRKITDLKVPTKGYRTIWDAETRGLGVRLSYTGARAFVFDFTTEDGRRRRMVIGEWSNTFGVAKARAAVAAHRLSIEGGDDPLASKREERRALSERWTVADLADYYLREHAEIQKRERSVKEDRAMLRQHILPTVGAKAVADITTHDVERLINSIARTGHRPRANRVRSLLSVMCNRAIRLKLRPAHDNPVTDVRKFREEPRERYLTADETTALMQALEEHRNQRIANAIRLLYLTGARRGEVLAAKWEEFNFERAVWTKPSHHTKQQRSHSVPLNSAALNLLHELKAKARPDEVYVFAGNDPGEPFKDIKKAWRAITARAGIENLRLHDLRHSFASALLARGVGLEVIGGLLGHTRMETTQRYSHLLDDTMREATERLTQPLPAPAAK